MPNTFFELNNQGLISFTGEDAASFLQGQLTSDVSGLPAGRTQYSGYCTPKGRLIATFLIWKREGEILIQLPAELRESVQSRLSKYVMRSRVKVADASTRFVLFGLAGIRTEDTVRALIGRVPEEMHAIAAANELEVTRLPIDRSLILVARTRADVLRTALASHAAPGDPEGWTALDVEAGVAVITVQTSEKYVPQMVNLDLVGGVSYSKGCYPGQEIVARTHYLGQQKQRMYRIRVPAGNALSVGDSLYSKAFGDQASGSIVSLGAGGSAGCVALAVIQRRSVEEGAIHLGRANGPRVEPLSLPYSLPG
jgi:tRNA-modifying protein YgfZ